MNNVPDPTLAGKDLPTFKFALEKSDGKVIGNSYGKEATVTQLPISKGIAGVSMRLEPGAMRELHWHATAAEWAFVLEGRVRTTVVDPGGLAETNDFDPGDVWYFPRGHGHMLQCLGDKPCHFILIFDNGYFSEFGTFSITDWIGHTPPALLAKNFGLPEAAFATFPEGGSVFRTRRIRRQQSRPCRCRAGSCRRRPTNTGCWRSRRMRPIAAAASGASIPAASRLRRRSRASCSISIILFNVYLHDIMTCHKMIRTSSSSSRRTRPASRSNPKSPRASCSAANGSSRCPSTTARAPPTRARS